MRTLIGNAGICDGSGGDAPRGGTPDQGRAFGIEKAFTSGGLALDGDRLDVEALKTSGRAIRVF